MTLLGYFENPFFSVKELACKGTGDVILHPGFLADLITLRESYGMPMFVTSGCRSIQHNKAVGGAANSLHLTENERFGCNTLAVDIKRPPGQHLHQLIQKATDLGWTVGIAKTFIHLDRRIVLDFAPVIYTYD